MPKEKFVALSGYCKANDLSVPKDFDVKKFAEDIKSEDLQIQKIYKFKESTLNKLVPELGFKEVKKRRVEPNVTRVFLLEDEDCEIAYLLINGINSDIEESVDILTEDIDCKEVYVESDAVLGALMSLSKAISKHNNSEIDFIPTKFEKKLKMSLLQLSDIPNLFKKTRQD